MGVLYARVSGAWVPIGAGSDEVWIGPDAPVDPSTEVWYDTDASLPASPSSIPWNMPWGLVARAVKVANEGGFPTSATDISGLSLTFTANGGRWLKLSGYLMCFQSVASAPVCTITDGANVVLQQQNLAPDTAPQAVNLFTVIAPGAGSYTVKMRMNAGTGSTVTVLGSATFPATLLVEDVGPVVPQ